MYSNNQDVQKTTTSNWNELWQISVRANVGLPLQHKYSPKLEIEIDERNVNKKRLSEEHIKYSQSVVD